MKAEEFIKNYDSIINWSLTAENELKRMLKEYGKIVCKEQREICGNTFSDKTYEALGVIKLTYGDMREIIRNSNEPEL